MQRARRPQLQQELAQAQAAAKEAQAAAKEAELAYYRRVLAEALVREQQRTGSMQRGLLVLFHWLVQLEVPEQELRLTL